MLKKDLEKQISDLQNTFDLFKSEYNDLALKYKAVSERADTLLKENNGFKIVFSSIFKNKYVQDQIKDIVREMMEDVTEESITNRMEEVFDYKLDKSDVQYKYRSLEE